MERDWYRRVMLKLVDAKDTRADEYLQILDSELDEIVLRLDEVQRAGGFSAFTQRRAYNMLTEMRSRLEVVRNGHEVRQVFMEETALEQILEDAAATLQAKKDL
jgi:hypothetical protein